MAIGEAVAGAVQGVANTGIELYKINRDNVNRANSQNAISTWNRDANNLLDKYYKNNIRLSGDSDAETYRSMKSAYDPSQYVYDESTDTNPNKVTFSKDSYNVEQYLNPYKDQVLKDVAGTAQHTAAGSAMGHSSGAADMINSAISDKSAELYDKAYGQMQSERSFDYGMYSDYIKQQQDKLNTMQQGYLSQMNLYRDDMQFDQNTTDNYLANKINLGNANMQAKASMV